MQTLTKRILALLLVCVLALGAAPAALRHELYHIRRWDVAYKVLMLAACCLHWFNPLGPWATAPAGPLISPA